MRPSHNPKAPHARVALTEVTRTRDEFLHRLRLLGAAQDVIDAAATDWEDATPEHRARVVGLSDAALVAELESIEREYQEGTETEDEEAARLAREHVMREAVEHVAANVRDVNAWVDADPDEQLARATAVEALESTGQQRKGVLEHVAAVIASHDG